MDVEWEAISTESLKTLRDYYWGLIELGYNDVHPKAQVERIDAELKKREENEKSYGI